MTVRYEVPESWLKYDLTGIVQELTMARQPFFLSRRYRFNAPGLRNLRKWS
jgi:hypothetical protein